MESRRTEYATVYANPDGATFTLEQSVVPVRVAKAAGGWQAPDATLETRRGRHGRAERPPRWRWRCRAAASDDPLARIEVAGRSLALDLAAARCPRRGWTARAPCIAEVLPDVDLKVTATAESFQQVLVVRTPEAAADRRT
ncbi:LamG domain protein jellyroll fold domain protein [Streptomyces californicus]